MKNEYDIKFVIRTVGDRPSDWYNDNKYDQLRYGGFLRALEGRKAGFVQYQDILNHLYKNQDIPVYSFNPQKDTYTKTKDTGLDAKVVATEVFESVPVDFQTKRKYIDDTIKLYSSLQDSQRVQTFVNSIESLASQDKKWLLDVQRNLPEIPLAPVYHFSSKKELEDFYRESNDDYILKARLGMAGVGTMRLDDDSLQKIDNSNVDHYVLQKDISPVLCELRLVFGPNATHLGTRAYYQRRAPWEDKATSNKIHKAIDYIPSQKEKSISKKIIEYSGVDVGSADWLIYIPKELTPPETSNAKEFSEFIQQNAKYTLAEVNGFGTNLGPLVSPYDLNEDVIKGIVNKYM